MGPRKVLVTLKSPVFFRGLHTSKGYWTTSQDGKKCQRHRLSRDIFPKFRFLVLDLFCLIKIVIFFLKKEIVALLRGEVVLVGHSSEFYQSLATNLFQ